MRTSVAAIKGFGGGFRGLLDSYSYSYSYS
jgi:hypothetical protein